MLAVPRSIARSEEKYLRRARTCCLRFPAHRLALTRPMTGAFDLFREWREQQIGGPKNEGKLTRIPDSFDGFSPHFLRKRGLSRQMAYNTVSTAQKQRRAGQNVYRRAALTMKFFGCRRPLPIPWLFNPTTSADSQSFRALR